MLKYFQGSDCMPTILVTGFAPFDQEIINPSFEAIKLLNDQIGDARIFKLEIPTVFTESAQYLINQITEINPDIVLMFGQAGGRKSISIERIAINIDDALIPDNNGNKPIDSLIDIHGNVAYFATIPIKSIFNKLNEYGMPVSISNTAGTYVCNHLMYRVLQYISLKQMKTIAGFIHVPYIHQQTIGKGDVFSMSLDEIVESMKLIIQAILEENR